MIRKFMISIAALPLVACGLNGTDGAEEDDANSAGMADSGPDFGYEPWGDDNYADTMASFDGEAGDGSGTSGGQPAIRDSQERPIMQAQVVLDRRGFGPGVIDGKMGQSTHTAIEGFQEANGLDVSGELDTATEQALARWSSIPATRVVTIPASWGELTFENVPEDAEDQAKMERLGYESLDEKLAERFHTTVEVLRELNPGGRPAGADASGTGATPSATATATPAPAPTASGSAGTGNTSAGLFRAGQQIRVPNIGADRIAPGAVEDPNWQQTLASLGVGTEQPQVTRIVVDESEKWLKAYDAGDKLVAIFSVTSGSSNDPLPIGDWGITGVAHNPPFAYDPTLFWDVPDSEEAQQLPPGPNGPVGVVWIDLTKEHYGIHGTSAPETIGRVQSHGCVRLTNWDAARLAQMVSSETEVIFQS